MARRPKLDQLAYDALTAAREYQVAHHEHSAYLADVEDKHEPYSRHTDLAYAQAIEDKRAALFEAVERFEEADREDLERRYGQLGERSERR